MIKRCALILGFLAIQCLAAKISHAVTLTKDTLWQGQVKLTEDVLVPAGVTLTIRPGTRVVFVSSESTKTEPEYLSSLTELTIRGTLIVEGTDQGIVEFAGEENKPGSWAGIIIDQGRAVMHSFRIRNAETAIQVFDGELEASTGVVQENRYGIVVQGAKAKSRLNHSKISGNDYGIGILQGAQVAVDSCSVSGNRKKDRFSSSSHEFRLGSISISPSETPVSRRYGDEALRGDIIWQGRVQIAGNLRIPQGSRLIVLPGTIVEFIRRDADGDRIGENGLLIQGRLIAKGTKEQPIVFRSAEKDRRMGDWDAINIMDSAEGQNLIEHCLIEDAYRGLHFHFSNVAVHDTYIRKNYRAIQFQESQVELVGNYLVDNKSGVQGRDSDVTMVNNTIYNNYVGANFFRTSLVGRDNKIIGNWKDGWRIREGISDLQENLIDGNRQGLMLADMFYGSYRRNCVTNNFEAGISLRNADNVDLVGNIIAGNGSTGLNAQDSRAMIKGNQISDNVERGLGVMAFNGWITENNIAHNGQYAIEVDGISDVSAASNWWGGDDPAKIMLDKSVETSRGRVLYDKPVQGPFVFGWPLQDVVTDQTWRGIIAVEKNVTVSLGATLKIAPGTTVQFGHGTGLAVKGRMLASGKPDQKIRFTSSEKKGPSDWDEVQLEYATGSIVAHCVFEYANWGLHSHFTNLSVTDSHFTNNFGGMRFRSGPVQISNCTFDNNSIGIRAYLGNAVISENIITKNETGIFVREKGGGLKITRNNISDNSNYNIRVGDFNDEDVPARENWWGDAGPATTIFDGRNEPGIGNVLYDPILTQPVKLPGVKR